MFFQFTVSVEVERTEGKFASRDELQELILAEIENASPSELMGEAGGTYEVVSYDVEHDDAAIQAMETAAKKRRAAARRERKEAAQRIARQELEAAVKAAVDGGTAQA